MVAGDRQRSFLNDMHRARPTSGAAIVPALLLGACSGPATADPCVTDGVQTDPPVACAGSNLAVLAQYEFPSERWTAQIGASHQAIALDATDVYWSDVGGRALRTPKNGGPTEELLPDTGCSITDVAVDDTYVFFGQNCRLDGSGSDFPIRAKLARMDKLTHRTLDLALTELAEFRHIVPAGDQVYFTMFTLDEIFLRTVSRDGPTVSAAAPFGPIVHLQTAHLPFVLSDKDVYYADNSTLRIVDRKDDGTSIDLATTERFVLALTEVNGTVHWLDEKIQQSQAVYRLWRAPNGGTAELAIDGPVVEHMTGDAEAYVGAGDLDLETSITDRVYRWQPSGGRVALAAGLHRPEGIALDTESVYVTDLTLPDRTVRLKLLKISR